MPSEITNEIKEELPLLDIGSGDPSQEGVFSTIGGRTDTLGNYSAKVRVYKSGTQNIASPTKVEIETETYDSGNNYDTTNYRFVAPIDGYYFVNGQVGMDAVPVGQGVALYIYKNGAEFAYMINYFNGPAGNTCKTTITDLVPLNKGDYIELWAANTESPTARAVETGESKTFMTVHFFSLV